MDGIYTVYAKNSVGSKFDYLQIRVKEGLLKKKFKFLKKT